MSIRYKILSGFLLLVSMLIIAGAFSLMEFSKISKSAKNLLDDNYRSIEASKTMLEALEKEDKGVLLLLHGNWKEGRELLRNGDSLLNTSLHVVQNKITEKNEEAYIDTIKNRYTRYKSIWEKPIVDTDREDNLNWYYNESHEAFIAVKKAVKEFMSHNQNSMYQEATSLKEKAKRAVMPGIVAIFSAFIFVFLFNFFINHFFITPIEKLTKELENFYPRKGSLDTKIETRGELGRLKEAINNMIQKLKKNQ